MVSATPPPPDPAWGDRDFLLAYEKLHSEWLLAEEAARAAEREVDAHGGDEGRAALAQALREAAQARQAELLRMVRDRPL